MPNGRLSIQDVLSAIARRLGRPQDVQLDPFYYSIEIDLNANATANGQFLVQNDSAFAITATSGLITDQSDAFIANFQPFGSGGGTTIGIPVIIQLTDSGSGRILSDARVPYDSIFGTGQDPYHWPQPKVLDPSSVFQASAQNLSATAMTLRLVFHGYKIFGNFQAIEAFKNSR